MIITPIKANMYSGRVVDPVSTVNDGISNKAMSITRYKFNPHTTNVTIIVPVSLVFVTLTDTIMQMIYGHI